MATIEIPIYMRGVTGRMARRQHLERSLMAIAKEGGLKTPGGDVIVPKPYLLGRSVEKLKPLADEYGLPCGDDINVAFEDTNEFRVFFEGAITKVHHAGITQAIDAGMNIFSEKPITLTIDEAIDVAKRAAAKGIKGGVVQDKRYLPGTAALAHVINSGMIGDPFHVQLEFGYWVFPDSGTRPDWNSDKEAGGGIVYDMVAHWDYVLQMLVGRPVNVSALTDMAVKQRTRDGQPVTTTAEDSVYATFKSEQGVICSTASSWCRRPRKRGLLEIKVQGTKGAAEAYLDRCFVMTDERTPVIAWDPDTASRVEFDDGWERIEAPEVPANAFRYQWEKFLMHLVCDGENPADLVEGAQGVEASARAYESAEKNGAPINIRDIRSIL
ncbi:MAG: Gfo/Idh/MocA family oxidoreductase [Candidatus Hinthialibacter antarcticus]|nr:Gfo/Idh/MocA family oxidoreductase [Candidatus Hinthialibacter antarcticus]